MAGVLLGPVLPQVHALGRDARGRAAAAVRPARSAGWSRCSGHGSCPSGSTSRGLAVRRERPEDRGGTASLAPQGRPRGCARSPVTRTTPISRSEASRSTTSMHRSGGAARARLEQAPSTKLEKKAHGRASLRVSTPALVAELVEWPGAVLGSYPEEFLALPRGSAPHGAHPPSALLPDRGPGQRSSPPPTWARIRRSNIRKWRGASGRGRQAP